MKITLLQTDIVWGDPSANILEAEKMILDNRGSDLYVLPEMWSTGFATDPKGIAEEEETSISFEWMKSISEQQKCAVCGSLAIRTADGLYRNRQYFIDGRNGICKHYDKHHLFTYGGENIHYKAGSENTIVDYCGFRILLVTCYDLRFPVWSRYSSNLQYDLILCVANWPSSRQNAFQILTRARAIENMSYLVAVNRVGNDDYSHYSGYSCIISPIGKTLVSCKPNIQSTASYNLDLQSLQNKRSKFKVLDDRDIV